jgi:sec-independent protein translocase protein TatA
MGRIGGGELLLILLIALLVFGPSKLADMGKGLGEGLKNFKKGLSPDDQDKKAPPPAAPEAGADAKPVDPSKGNTPPAAS